MISIMPLGSIMNLRGSAAMEPSLGERQRPQAEAYVNGQKEHHSQQTSIAWLERDTDLDEGPPDTGLPSTPVPAIARESQTTYIVEGESPF
jgi:hypothetical protein